MDPIRVMGLTSDEFAQEAKERVGRGSGVARQLYRSAHCEGSLPLDDLGLSPQAVLRWRAVAASTPLEVVRTVADTSFDGRETIKAVMRTEDGLEVECVRIPMGRDRFTLCVSSQVGCRMACAFCETAKIGLVRSLRADEIVAQVVTARSALGWDVSHVVFMGMGEPLDNAAALTQALRVLNDRRGLGFAQTRLTVCTAGHELGLSTLESLGWRRLGLSVSLNGTTDEIRSRIMPLNRSVPLKRLSAALVRYRRMSRAVFSINYCLLPDWNDTREDASRIAAFCGPLGRSIVHVIPYNPGTRPLTRAPQDVEVDRFCDWLREEGVPVQQRRIKGRSVMAACGQLGNLELRSRRQRRLAVYEGSSS